MRTILIIYMLSLFLFPFCKPSYAEMSFYSCKEPQKFEALYVFINWQNQKVSFDKRGFVAADNWNKGGISWAYNAKQKLNELVKSQPRMSLFFDLQDETLLLTILDSKTITPKTADDWAKFLPAYFECKEFF